MSKRIRSAGRSASTRCRAFRRSPLSTGTAASPTWGILWTRPSGRSPRSWRRPVEGERVGPVEQILMLIQNAEVSRLLVARLNPGDDLLRSLTDLVRQND